MRGCPCSRDAVPRGTVPRPLPPAPPPTPSPLSERLARPRAGPLRRPGSSLRGPGSGVRPTTWGGARRAPSPEPASRSPGPRHGSRTFAGLLLWLLFCPTQSLRLLPARLSRGTRASPASRCFFCRALGCSADPGGLAGGVLGPRRGFAFLWRRGGGRFGGGAPLDCTPGSATPSPLLCKARLHTSLCQTLF